MADGEPTVSGRIARWAERSRLLRARVQEARTRHGTLDLGLELVERDSAIGGALLAGALAYRLFVLLLPTSLLLITGLGLYAGSVGESVSKAAHDAGLHGVIGSQVAETASGRHKLLVFLLMIPAIAYALATLYRAIAKVHGLAWLGSARGVRTSARGIALLGAALAVQLVATEIVTLVSRTSLLEAVLALLVYAALVAAAWLAVSLELPHGDVGWARLLPGAALVGVGLFGVHVFNRYITTWIIEGRANTYGALGIATALLFSLVLVGRLIVVSAQLNAALDERRTERDAALPDRS
ncbi:MAG TPA: hypothetical protein VFU10_00305 [Gaiellaceae bacterium]|nr:hypothetical protein [Gaiellaceae bacterium]